MARLGTKLELARTGLRAKLEVFLLVLRAKLEVFLLVLTQTRKTQCIILIKIVHHDTITHQNCTSKGIKLDKEASHIHITDSRIKIAQAKA